MLPGRERHERFGAADVLSFAAAPTFVVMAVLTGAAAGEPMPLCAPMQHGFQLGGMAAMYLLMSAFHLSPWLRLVFARRAGGTVRHFSGQAGS